MKNQSQFNIYLKKQQLQKQGGYVLFIVLIMMLVISFVVISNMQGMNTEMRISSNDADRKFAFIGAENALALAEERIVELKHDGFSIETTGVANTCKLGLCGENASAQTLIWTEEGGKLVPADNGFAKCSNGAAKTNNSCYVIERMGSVIDGNAVYRITARAWGQNENTVVTLQSFVDYQD